MFLLSILFLIVALVAVVASFFVADRDRAKPAGVAAVLGVLAVICFGLSMFTVVPASHVGVVTTFGKVSNDTLPEGAHFVLPWARAHEVFTGVAVAQAKDSEAGSKDLQSVHATLTVNYHPDASKARELYQLNPALNYQDAFVVPSTHEVFKAVVSGYTAEELVTKRNDVSQAITRALNVKLAPYYLTVTNVNLVDFGFSKAFNAAIEEKVTASQKAATAQRNLEKVKYEADARVAQAEGEAKAIAIQAAAVEKQGGAAYTQLKAIEKWDGKLPTQMLSGQAMPFVNLTK